MTVVSDSLLSAPMSGTIRAEVHFDRFLGKDYSNLSERFLYPSGKNYSIQYYHVYRSRFAALKPLVEASARSSLGPKAPIKRLSELSSGVTDTVLLIGTLYKLQKNKPNILRQLEGEEQPSRGNYTSSEDELILEDEEQRIKLVGDGINKETLVTGIILGVYGRQSQSGKFTVEKIFYPASQRIMRYTPTKSLYIAFLSNIRISPGNPSRCLELLQLAIDWISGFEGCPKDQERNASIERLIIAGGLIQSGVSQEETFESVRLLENALLQLVKSLKVDILPEESLSNASLPQQPLHKCLFPRAAAYVSTLQTVTNPYYFKLEDTLIHGTSGGNLRDIAKNSSLSDPLDIMERLLLWAHIAPTSPDTLGCFPYKDRDPLIMENRPHVLFSGGEGASALSSRTVEENLLLSLPDFSLSGSMVLLNLKDLSTQEIKFSVE
uniref:DNA polymerase subunit delta-2 n=1 Tax=Caligus rogercresseyi TaxID=217165 RepID=C1BP80_CALRO|nr:DNA polymerase subunit delta-2 [Caligus rogercresseyi]